MLSSKNSCNPALKFQLAVSSGRGVPENVLARIEATKAAAAKSKEAIGPKKSASKFQALLDEPYNTFAQTDGIKELLCFIKFSKYR